MSDCKHQRITTWVTDDANPAGLWSCAICGIKFVPLDVAQDADARRYRFLRSDFSPMGLSADGRHAWAYRRNASLRGPTLDEAIDAAREKP